MNLNQRADSALSDMVDAGDELVKAMKAYFANEPTPETRADLVLAQEKYDKACVALEKARAERTMARCAAILNQ